MYARNAGSAPEIRSLPVTADGTTIVVIRGGVNMVTTAPKLGTIDIEADNVVIWKKAKPKQGAPRIGVNGEVIENQDDPMEVYLEGHVIFYQDQRKLQGTGDQRKFEATRAYYDYRSDRFV